MSKNTVILSLEEYHRLFDFEKEVVGGNRIAITENGCLVEFLTESEALDRVSEINEQLIDQEKLTKKSIKVNVSSLRRMSLWQFFKWRNREQFYCNGNLTYWGK